MATVLELPKPARNEEADILRGEIFLAEFWLTRRQDELRKLLMQQLEVRKGVRRHKATLDNLRQRLEEIEKGPAESTGQENTHR